MKSYSGVIQEYKDWKAVSPFLKEKIEKTLESMGRKELKEIHSDFENILSDIKEELYPRRTAYLEWDDSLAGYRGVIKDPKEELEIALVNWISNRVTSKFSYSNYKTEENGKSLLFIVSNQSLPLAMESYDKKWSSRYYDGLESLNIAFFCTTEREYALERFGQKSKFLDMVLEGFKRLDYTEIEPEVEKTSGEKLEKKSGSGELGEKAGEDEPSGETKVVDNIT